MKEKISQVIVVEGRDDTANLKRYFDVETYETRGSAINEKDLERIQRLHQRHGIIVFTDPDFNGERIRRMIMTAIPTVQHAFLKRDEAVPKSKTKGRSLGIEHASYEDLKTALAQVTEQFENENEFDISRSDLIRLGFLAGADSRKRREYLGEAIRIGYSNGKQLLKRLELFGVTLAEVEEAMKSYSVTKAVLERHGFTFKKSFGQNFLTDTNILQKIVDTAEIDDQVNVIEIGPGIGALTEFLAERAAEVMAFEIDHRLVPILADTLRDFDNVTVVNEDILKVDLAQHIQNFKNPDLPIKVVANLPYYITTPILMHLIESGIPFSEFVVMMQKEVADRISAQPNTKAYGSLSIAVQYYMTAKVAFIVPRTVFVPAPNVDSAILKMVRRPEPAVAVEDENFFFKVSKASFTHRRKTLWNNLTGYFGKTEEVKDKLTKALDQAGLSPSVRGEALSLAEFASLADALKGQGL